jgi:hypothetical protein
MKRAMLMALVSASMIACQEPVQTNSQQNEITWHGKEILSSAHVDHEAGEQDQSTSNKELVEMIFNELIYQENVEITDWDGEPMTLEHLKSNVLTQVRKIQVEDPNSPGSFVEVVDTMTVEIRDVIEILTLEEWDFNRTKMSLQKRINRMGVVVNSIDNDGTIRGKKLLFYLKLNN